MNRDISGFAFTLLFASCASLPTEPVPVGELQAKKVEKSTSALPEPDSTGSVRSQVDDNQGTNDARVKVSGSPSVQCHAASGAHRDLPLWSAEHGIVVTRVLKECLTADGRRVFDAESPWMAMGIPCTGDGGKIDYKGDLYDPKLVSFILSTDCAMQPADLETVKSAGVAALGLDPKAKLLAYNPMAIQYWEVPGLNDADVGFTVDLRTNESLQRLWKGFADHQQGIPVVLYGRENAWVMGEQFFAVHGELVKTSRLRFRLNVKAIKALSADEIAQVKANCETLKPARNCFRVFK